MGALCTRDDVATQLHPSLRLAFRYVRTAKVRFDLERNRVESPALRKCPNGIEKADGFVQPIGPRGAYSRHRIELGQPPMVVGPCGFDEFLGPRAGFILFDP